VIAFETDVRIDRRIEHVFAYVSDPLNLPRWNSAVQAVRRTSADQNGGASTYMMERELPTGRAVNELEVVASEPPREFAIRTTAGPTPFLYRYQLSVENGETVVKLEAEVELPRAAAFLPQLAGRLVKKGVNDNLATLKQILEDPIPDRPTTLIGRSLDGEEGSSQRSLRQVLWAFRASVGRRVEMNVRSL
jgi:uncharacterized protein YndB with AHSA1/START domain